MTKVLENLNKKERIFLSLIFLITFGLLISDVWEDLEAGSSWSHVGAETIILVLSVMGFFIIWSRNIVYKKDLTELKIDLQKAKSDLNSYKQRSEKYVKGLSDTIDKQMDAWGLTKAEKEITLLILKGLTNKEISDIRETSERTVRQQLTAIFQKSNLTTRLEISAFFLEDLLVISED